MLEENSLCLFCTQHCAWILDENSLCLFCAQTQKLRLSQFEHKFEEKVREVDDRYHNKVQDLVMQNIELR